MKFILTTEKYTFSLIHESTTKQKTTQRFVQDSHNSKHHSLTLEILKIRIFSIVKAALFTFTDFWKRFRDIFTVF